MNVCAPEKQERLIVSEANWRGVDLLSARFTKHQYAPHRHDRYAVGITTHGVQTFFYRGAQRHCRQGDGFVLHPDELHDGYASHELGYGYRIAYVDPGLILHASSASRLPFVADPVITDEDIISAIRDFLDTAAGSNPVAREAKVTRLSDALWQASGTAAGGGAQLDLRALTLARDALMDAMAPLSSRDLSQLTGLSRWELARQFRRAFGVSPYRFQVMRRLEHARRCLDGSEALSAIALDCGFADQAHMTRHFKKTFGMTPRQWRSLRRIDQDVASPLR